MPSRRQRNRVVPSASKVKAAEVLAIVPVGPEVIVAAGRPGSAPRRASAAAGTASARASAAFAISRVLEALAT